MVTPIALNHLGLTVPDIDRAIDWYGNVMGFRLIFRRTLQVRANVPEVSQIFGPTFRSAYQAHLVTANGIGLELFQFVEPAVTKPSNNFDFARTGIFHLCVTDPDVHGLAARIIGRQDGVILVEAHTKGGPVQLSVENHRSLGQMLKTVGADPANELMILTGTGDEFMMDSDPEGFALEEKDLAYWAYEYAYKDGRINVSSCV